MPQAAELQGCTCFRLRRLNRAVSRLYDQHLAIAGLRTTQYSLLKNVAIEPLPISVLAARLLTERTTLSRNLKPLADAGLVTITAGPDTRQRIVSITRAGLRAIDRARAAWREAQEQFNTIVGEAEVIDLHRRIDATLTRIAPLVEEI